jgi:hypothetical protein
MSCLLHLLCESAMHNIKMQRTADVSTGLLYDSLAAADLGVDVAKPSVQGLLVDSLGFWVQWGKEVSYVSPH